MEVNILYIHYRYYYYTRTHISDYKTCEYANIMICVIISVLKHFFLYPIRLGYKWTQITVYTYYSGGKRNKYFNTSFGIIILPILCIVTWAIEWFVQFYTAAIDANGRNRIYYIVDTLYLLDYVLENNILKSI